MKYRAIRKVMPYEKAHKMFNDGVVYKELALKIVMEMPEDTLKKVFNIEKIEPEIPSDPTVYRAEIVIV